MNLNINSEKNEIKNNYKIQIDFDEKKTLIKNDLNKIFINVKNNLEVIKKDSLEIFYDFTSIISDVNKLQEYINNPVTKKDTEILIQIFNKITLKNVILKNKYNKIIKPTIQYNQSFNKNQSEEINKIINKIEIINNQIEKIIKEITKKRQILEKSINIID